MKKKKITQVFERAVNCKDLKDLKKQINIQ